MTTYYDLTGVQRDCLHAIASFDNPTVAAVKKWLDDYHSEGISRTRLYEALEQLEQKGLIITRESTGDLARYSVSLPGGDLLDNHAEIVDEIREQWRIDPEDDLWR